MITTRLNIVLVAAATAAAFILPAAPADAKRSKAAKRGTPAVDLRLQLLDATLESLPFGGDLDAVMEWIRGREEARHARQLKDALDTRERTNLRQRMDQDLADIRGSYVEFDGRRTGYEVSVLSGEFAPGAKEGVLKYIEGAKTHYLFFTHGQLWKYARPMEASERFDDRIRRLSKDLGAMPEVKRAGGSETGAAELASWNGSRRALQLSDRRRLYSTDLLLVVDTMLARRIDDLRGGKKPVQRNGAVDPDLDDFLESPEDLEVEDPSAGPDDS